MGPYGKGGSEGKDGSYVGKEENKNNRCKKGITDGNKMTSRRKEDMNMCTNNFTELTKFSALFLDYTYLSIEFQLPCFP